MVKYENLLNAVTSAKEQTLSSRNPMQHFILSLSMAKSGILQVAIITAC